MVYRGRSPSRRRYRSRPVNRRGGGSHALLSACLWLLLVAVAVRLVWPEQLEKLKSEALRLIGSPDIGGAVQVFGQQMKDGGGFAESVKDAWQYAFKTEDDGSVPADGDISGADVLPAISDAGLTGENDGDGAALDPVAAFMESQAEYSQLDLPENVTYDMPELGVDIVAPASGVLTSGFGYREHPSDGRVRFHYGIDIGAAEGTPVLAAAGGEVEAVGDSSDYGLYVIIRHRDGFETLYAHMGEVSVTGGSAVNAGDAIGSVGSTGNATGACLHLEMIVDGNYVNPEYYVNL